MNVPAIGTLPRAGVAAVLHEATMRGYVMGHPDWCNLGQGQPDIGPLPGAPERIARVDLRPLDCAYGPIGGTDELRQLIADHYNRLFRGDRSSKYTKDNVSVAAGGRPAIARAIAALGDISLGFQAPDYPGYADILRNHAHRLKLRRMPTDPAAGFVHSSEYIRDFITRFGLSAYLFSNPNNPTGQVVADADLASYCQAARDTKCLFLVDEFYSQYVYSDNGSTRDSAVSCARFVRNVNNDPLLIIDGLTKNFRYPGCRIGWVIGPDAAIEQINRAAAGLDGGPSMPSQRMAMKVLEPRAADAEARAIRSNFAQKRAYMLTELSRLGVRFDSPGRSTFYLWGNISELMLPLNSASEFFAKALETRVIVIPGNVFDFDPSNTEGISKKYNDWIRFSYGPPEGVLVTAIDRLSKVLKS